MVIKANIFDVMSNFQTLAQKVWQKVYPLEELEPTTFWFNAQRCIYNTSTFTWVAMDIKMHFL